MKKPIIIALVVLLFYVTSYVLYRNSHIQVWEKDQKAYVIFPTSQKWVYYLYRPATYLDSKLTPMRFHIGEHQE